MDAAQKLFKNSVLVIALSLLSAPVWAQAPSFIVASTVTLSNSQTGTQIPVTSSGTQIAFTVSSGIPTVMQTSPVYRPGPQR